MAVKTLTPEFSRPFEIARLPNSGCHERLTANDMECANLAKRMQLPTIHALKATLLAKPWRGGGVKLTGEIHADIDQESVISLETFRDLLTIPVERYFLPSSKLMPAEDDDMVDVLTGGSIDLGEIVAETLALELDPYPRKPGERFGGEEP